MNKSFACQNSVKKWGGVLLLATCFAYVMANGGVVVSYNELRAAAITGSDAKLCELC